MLPEKRCASVPKYWLMCRACHKRGTQRRWPKCDHGDTRRGIGTCGQCGKARRVLRECHEYDFREVA